MDSTTFGALIGYVQNFTSKAIASAELGIASVEVEGTKIIFTFEDDTTAEMTFPTPADGEDGEDGVSIVDVDINASKHLIITLSDGNTVDAGALPTPDMSDYYTKTETDNKFNPKTNFKTINGNSIIGTGNIPISGGGGGEGTNVVINPILSGNEETATSILVGEDKYVFPVVNTYGFTPAQITMFEGILRAGTYSSDQSSAITAFIESLSESPEPTQKVLTSITAVLNNPTVEQGQTYTPNAIVTAHYDDSSSAVVTSGISYSTIDTSTTGEKTLTISYTENEVTKTTTATVTVVEPTPKTLLSISATKTKTSYTVDETFSTSDVVVTAHYSDSTTATVTSSATIGTIDTSTTGNKTLEISYTEDGVTKSTSIAITVGTVPAVELVYKYGKRTQYNSQGDIISPSSKAFACTIGSVDTSAPLIADLGIHAIPKGNLTHLLYSGENTKVHSAYYTSDGTVWHPMSASGNHDIPSEATYFGVCVISNDETTSASTYSAEIESGLTLS